MVDIKEGEEKDPNKDSLHIRYGSEQKDGFSAYMNSLKKACFSNGGECPSECLIAFLKFQ